MRLRSKRVERVLKKDEEEKKMVWESWDDERDGLSGLRVLRVDHTIDPSFRDWCWDDENRLRIDWDRVGERDEMDLKLWWRSWVKLKSEVVGENGWVTEGKGVEVWNQFIWYLESQVFEKTHSSNAHHFILFYSEPSTLFDGDRSGSRSESLERGLTITRDENVNIKHLTWLSSGSALVLSSRLTTRYTTYTFSQEPVSEAIFTSIVNFTLHVILSFYPRLVKVQHTLSQIESHVMVVCEYCSVSQLASARRRDQ